MRRLRGATMVEVLTTCLISTSVVLAATGVFLAGTSGYAKSQAKLGAVNEAQRAARASSALLRQAMSVTIAGDGNSLTFRWPRKTVAGDFVQPVEWDGVTRTLGLSGGNLVLGNGGSSRTLARGILAGGVSGGYDRIFSAGPGAIVRSVTMQFASRQVSSYRKTSYTIRRRETISLRNVPELSR